MRRVTIKKLSDNPNPYFAQGELGSFLMMLGPSVGQSFVAHKGMDSGITTTTVKSVGYVDEKTVRFKTRNSEYEIIMGDEIHG